MKSHPPPPPPPATPSHPSYFERDAKDLIRKLLTADRTRRIGTLHGGAGDIKAHSWFRRVNWDTALASGLTPPYAPIVKGVSDTSNFDSYPDSDGDETMTSAKEISLDQHSFFLAIDAL